MSIIGRAFKAPFSAIGRGFEAATGNMGALAGTPLFHSLSVAGAAGGAALGAFSSEDRTTGALAGGAAGAGIGMAAPVLAGAGIAGVGAAGIGLARSMPAIGRGLVGAAGAAAQMGAGAFFGAQTGNAFLNNLLNPVGRLGRTIGGLGSRMIKVNPGRSLRIGRGGDISTIGLTRRPLQLTGLGAGIFIGGALIGGARGAVGAFTDSRKGEMDRHLTTATPRMPIDFAGATGDLVFAMNANRRG